MKKLNYEDILDYIKIDGNSILATTDMIAFLVDELEDMGYRIEENESDYEIYDVLLLEHIDGYYSIMYPYKDDEIVYILADTLLVENGILSRKDLGKLTYDQLIEFSQIEEEECYDCCGLCECEECGQECCDGDIDDEDEDVLYKDLADLLDEYTDKILETDGCPKCINDALVEFSIEILENFGLEKLD